MTSQPEEKIIEIKSEQYLGDVLSSLPSGRIFKRYTGIGATTVEIKDQRRNSIIVCPTRALAAGKAISEDIFYIGGEFPGITASPTEEVIESLKDDSAKTKVMVVADSLIRLYNELGDYKEAFFYMFDEIDSFQSESNYRPNLEKCLDIYFQIDASRRNMVSATLLESLDERIKAERKTKIILVDEILPLTNVIHAQESVLKVLVEQIKKRFEELTDDEKLLIGYNTLKGIIKTVTILPTELQQNIGILCSEASYDDVPEEYRTKLENGKLERKITFMTSAYFAGVDISERCHVVAVSDTSYPFSLLLKAKIYQIFGRPRNGVASQSFVFNINPDYYYDIDEYEGRLSRKAGKVLRAAKSVFNDADDDMTEDERKESTKMISDIIERNQVRSVELVRHDKGDILRNRLNIDYLYHRKRAENLLYSDISRAIDELGIVFDVKFESSNATLSELEIKQLDDSKSNLPTINQTRALQILAGPYGDGVYVTAKNLFEKTIQKILDTPRKGRVATTVKKLIEGVIIDHNCHQGKLNKILENLLIYRMTTLKEPQKALDRKFKIGDSYTSAEIHDVFIEMAELKTLDAYRDIFPSGITQKKAVELFNKIFATERSSRTTEESGKTDAYKTYKKNIQFQENI